MKDFLKEHLEGFTDAGDGDEAHDRPAKSESIKAVAGAKEPGSFINDAADEEGEEDEMVAFLREAFEENYELLRLAGGAALSPDAKEVAFQHVLLYWRKMRHVAERVTDTEVRLTLPAQKTPAGRTFGIEGVVDIVREHGETVMYDIKTHDVDSVRSNLELYERQLNVYAYIWQHLRGQPLDRTAVIATSYPDDVRAALEDGDETRIERALARWNPLVEVPFDVERVEATIEDFGHTVDQIEEGSFAPAPLERLKARQPGSRTLFASRVCSNCDARFSCTSYRAYALGADTRREARFRTFFADVGSDLDRNARLSATLETTPDAAALEEQQ